jgi:hypothetical protein
LLAVAANIPNICCWLITKTGLSSVLTSFPSRPASRTTTVYNSTTVIAPPVVAPPVYGGFGFGSPFGFSIMPTFVMPVPFLGGILQVGPGITQEDVYVHVVVLVAGPGLFGFICSGVQPTCCAPLFSCCRSSS